MEKQIKIKVPEGFEIDKEKSTFETIVFKELPKVSKEQEMSDFLFEMFNKVNRQKITGEKELTSYVYDEWLYQQDYKNGKLYIRYSLIWQVFESKHGLNYNQIRDFIHGWVETNLGWKGLTPNLINPTKGNLVETNLGWKGLTPIISHMC